MHDIEPYYHWRHLYTAEEDARSPFYGQTYSEFEFSQTVYNYYIHPQWDSIGSKTLYVKIIYADYDSNEIYKATIKCLYDEKFRKISKEGLNPYWKGGAGVKVANFLANLTINQELIRKKMTLKSKIVKVSDNG